MARRAHSLRLRDYLQHIIDAVGRIRGYTAHLSREGFMDSSLVQDAAIRNLEVIGETCRNILRHHEDFAAAHPEIPWRSPYEMRNALAHGYFAIDYISTWMTIQRDLPELEKQVLVLLAQLDAEPDC